MPEITSVVRSSTDPEHGVALVGGCGWTKHVGEVIKEMDDGVRYFVAIHGARVNVRAMYDRARPYLRTDPAETVENGLLQLPEHHGDVG